MSVMGIKRRTADGENKVTLFPFLAVLLCAMGALIMLLVVIARNVREQSVLPIPVITKQQEDVGVKKLTVDEAEKILEQIKMKAEEADWFAENISVVKKEAVENLAEKKTQLALAEKQTQKVEDELERLTKLAEQLHQSEKTNAAEVEKLQKTLEQCQRQLQEEELELAELQKENGQNKKSYAVVPYQGNSKTFRRPIYIECRDGKVIIQPEGIELTEDDFRFTDRPDNPLDAVLRTARQYYIETNQIVRGTEPYPLLIVRPSGVLAYEATRQAVGTWIKEFGYELVEEDWKIEYPEPSQELKERMEKQLAVSRNRLAGYWEAMQSESFASSRRSQQYRLDHRGNIQPVQPDGSDLITTIPRNNKTNRNNRPQSVTPNSVTPDPDISLVERKENGNSELPSPLQNNNDSLQWENSGGMLSHQPAIPTPASQPYLQPYAQSYNQFSVPQNPNPDYLTQNSKEERNFPMDGSENQLQKNQFQKEQLSKEWLQGNPLRNSSTLSSGDSPAFPQNFNTLNTSDSQTRKNNWAIRDAVPFSAAVSRNIKIQCEADKFVLVPQTGLIGVQVISKGDSSAEMVDKLVLAIWEFMDSWGPAGEKMYWRPILQVRVLTGAEQRFQELKYFLRNSGIIIVMSDE
jgi:hypothetical protein